MSQFEYAPATTRPAETPVNPFSMYSTSPYGVGVAPTHGPGSYGGVVIEEEEAILPGVEIIAKTVEDTSSGSLMPDPIVSVWDSLEGTPQSLFLVAIVAMVAACVIYFIEKRGGRM